MPNHQKSQMKRFSCDFYKQSGLCTEFEKIPIKEERRQKNKLFMQFILICYGDSVEVEVKTLEQGDDFVFKRTIQSGQCLLVDQRCRDV